MKKRTVHIVVGIFVGMILTLSCSLSGLIGSGAEQGVDLTKVALEAFATGQAAAQNPVVDTTKVVLELQATQAASDQQQLAIAETQKAMAITQEAMAAVPPAGVVQAEPPAVEAAQPTPTEDMTEKIKGAKILVYEDTQDIGLWVSDALDGMDVEYVFVADRIGTLMENLNSPIKWDLIIIAAESKTSVQGEFWDVINEKVTKDKTALIAEVWYVDTLGGGRLKNLLTSCGVQFQADYPLAESIYWLDESHPLFASPNIAMPLIHYSRYWSWQAGDYLRLAPGSSASLLAGAFQKRKSDYGLITSCMDGRVVLQTFCNHDFHKDEITRLWQNYVTYTLTSHFKAMP